MNKRIVFGLLASAAIIGLSGCSGMQSRDDLEMRLKETERENASLKQSLQGLRGEMSTRDAQSAGEGDAGNNLLPPKAQPGECYARVFAPAQYKDIEKTVLVKEAGKRIQTVPAVYEWVEEKVLVKEPTEVLKVIPAKYDWVEERVLVKEASSKLIEEPAVYETEYEKVLVRDAYTTWKKGRGPIEKIDDATGEIMCLVEVPAEYKNVAKRVLVKPAGVRKVAIPAEYKVVRKRVVVESAKTATEVVPAEYKTIRVRKMVKDASEQQFDIPAEYRTIKERQLVSEGELEWRPILCETNTTKDVVKRLQVALKDDGFDPGPIDGIVGRQTMAAVKAYQRKNGLAVGQLTLETLKKLGVMSAG